LRQIFAGTVRINFILARNKEVEEDSEVKKILDKNCEEDYIIHIVIKNINVY
jgi:hypothetical protein